MKLIFIGDLFHNDLRMPPLHQDMKAAFDFHTLGCDSQGLFILFLRVIFEQYPYEL